MKMRMLVLVFVVFAISGMAQAVVGSGAISVNFAENDWDGDVVVLREDQTVLPDEVAGYLPAAGWNNITVGGGNGSALTDDSGADSGSVINFTVANGWGDWSGGYLGADSKISRGYFDDTETSAGIGADISVSNIPYANYNVVLLLSTDGFDGGDWLEVEGGWIVTGTTSNGTYETYMVNGASQTSSGPTDAWAGDYYMGEWKLGENALVFTGLTDSSLSIQGVSRYADDDGSSRASIAGFQIVEVPEPASLILLSMGGIALLRRKRA